MSYKKVFEKLPIPASILKKMDVESLDDATIEAIANEIDSHITELRRNDPEYIKGIQTQSDGKSLAQTQARVKKHLKEHGIADVELKDKDLDGLLELSKAHFATLKTANASTDETVKSLQKAQTELIALSNQFNDYKTQSETQKTELQTQFQTQLKQRDIDSHFGQRLGKLKFILPVEDAQVLIKNKMAQRGLNLDFNKANTLILQSNDGGKIHIGKDNERKIIAETDIESLIIDLAPDLLAKANPDQPQYQAHSNNNGTNKTPLTKEMLKFATEQGLAV